MQFSFSLLSPSSQHINTSCFSKLWAYIQVHVISISAAWILHEKNSNGSLLAANDQTELDPETRHRGSQQVFQAQIHIAVIKRGTVIPI